jgi:hypothetical protein
MRVRGNFFEELLAGKLEKRMMMISWCGESVLVGN